MINVQDGNDLDALIEALEEAKAFKGKPSVIIANTVKGKGSAVMEGKTQWHHKVPNEQEYLQIVCDLEQMQEAMENENGQ